MFCVRFVVAINRFASLSDLIHSVVVVVVVFVVLFMLFLVFFQYAFKITRHTLFFLVSRLFLFCFSCLSLSRCFVVVDVSFSACILFLYRSRLFVANMHTKL